MLLRTLPRCHATADHTHGFIGRDRLHAGSDTTSYDICSYFAVRRADRRLGRRSSGHNVLSRICCARRELDQPAPEKSPPALGTRAQRHIIHEYVRDRFTSRLFFLFRPCVTSFYVHATLLRRRGRRQATIRCSALGGVFPPIFYWWRGLGHRGPAPGALISQRSRKEARFAWTFRREPHPAPWSQASNNPLLGPGWSMALQVSLAAGAGSSCTKAGS